MNEALWLVDSRGRFDVRPARRPTPGPGEVLVRVRAVAVNPVDALTGPFRRLVTPWVRLPAVLGSDVAGDVVEVGPGVTRFTAGDRVVAYAAGQEKARNRPEEGAFQRYVVVLQRVCSPLPEGISFERAAVLPLALATAAAGLFERDQLALPFPDEGAKHRDAVILVWGGSTSVGMNAVQLARGSGFSVIATAGRANHDLVRSLGAEAVADYRDADVDEQLILALRGRRLAGSIAIGRGSLTHALRLAHRTAGSKRIASAYPDPITRVRSLLARPRGIHVSTIWGGTPVLSPVGPAVFRDYLPKALADGRLRPAPEARVVGTGLSEIPTALAILRKGVSASKLVVTIEPSTEES